MTPEWRGQAHHSSTLTVASCDRNRTPLHQDLNLYPTLHWFFSSLLWKIKIHETDRSPPCRNPYFQKVVREILIPADNKNNITIFYDAHLQKVMTGFLPFPRSQVGRHGFQLWCCLVCKLTASMAILVSISAEYVHITRFQDSQAGEKASQAKLLHHLRRVED